jgi:DNA-binding NarL/FixJ family response regulator
MDRVAAEAGTYHRARAALATLSAGEHEVAVAVAQGKTNAEIAAQLHPSVATVKAHFTRILTKFELGNRTQIALLIHDAGLC